MIFTQYIYPSGSSPRLFLTAMLSLLTRVYMVCIVAFSMQEMYCKSLEFGSAQLIYVYVFVYDLWLLIFVCLIFIP